MGAQSEYKLWATHVGSKGGRLSDGGSIPPASKMIRASKGMNLGGFFFGAVPL